MERIGRRIVSADGELAELLNKTLTSYYRTGYIKFDGCILPESYSRFADAIENFQVREDDVWLSSFPKTGTTWTQEMVWSIANDLDFDRGKVPIQERFPSLEFSELFDIEEIRRRNPGLKIPELIAKDSVNVVEEMPSPRFVKTHLPFHMLPRQIRNGEKKPKIIYVTRNPKDTCISYYHHCKLVDGFKGSFDDFCDLFLGDTIYYAPFWTNVLSFWNKRTDYNILFLKYEDMKKDLPSVIRKTADFLGKNLDNYQVSLLNEHLSFSSMRENPAVNYGEAVSQIHKMLQVEREGVFMRSGNTGQWETGMNPERIKLFDAWTERHLQGTGLSM